MLPAAHDQVVTTGAPPADDPLWRQRWLLLASGVVITLAVALTVATHHDRWSWPLFVIGLAIGLCGLAFLEVGVAVITRVDRQEAARERAFFRRRRLIYAVTWIFIGALLGVVSAAFDQPVIDIAGGAWVALSLSAGTIAALVKARRQHAGDQR